MNISKEIKDDRNGDELLTVARLAVAFTHLQMAPWDGWGHERNAAEMAAFVVARSKQEGRFGMLADSMGVTGSASYKMNRQQS